jgi:hypothetical protein
MKMPICNIQNGKYKWLFKMRTQCQERQRSACSLWSVTSEMKHLKQWLQPSICMSSISKKGDTEVCDTIQEDRKCEHA